MSAVLNDPYYARDKSDRVELAYAKFRKDGDPTEGSKHDEAWEFFGAICELDHRLPDDDAELGRQVRRMVEACYRRTFERVSKT